MLLLQNLTVSIGQKIVIKDLSLEITSGSIHLIMGKNGSGKSSLASTIMGLPLYEVVSGSMQFQDQNLIDLSIHERSKRGLFLAFQQPVAIPGVVVFEFLKQIHAARGQESSPAEFQALVQTLCERVGLDQSCMYRGLHENFSGGEKKKLEVLQLLLLKPSCIILDEIDSGLDVDALRSIGTVITQYLKENPHVSCLLITHYQRILDYIQPDMVHIMHDGTIIHSGDVQVAFDVESQGYDIYG